jgi:hypothetical protein
LHAAKCLAKGTPQDECLEQIKEINRIINELGLSNFHHKKTLIDGKSICELFEVKPGKIMKPLIDELQKF